MLEILSASECAIGARPRACRSAQSTRPHLDPTWAPPPESRMDAPVWIQHGRKSGNKRTKPSCAAHPPGSHLRSSHGSHVDAPGMDPTWAKARKERGDSGIMPSCLTLRWTPRSAPSAADSPIELEGGRATPAESNGRFVRPRERLGWGAARGGGWLWWRRMWGSCEVCFPRCCSSASSPSRARRVIKACLVFVTPPPPIHFYRYFFPGANQTRSSR